MKVIRYSGLPVIPWKNGAGVRRDLLSGQLEDAAGTASNSTWMIGLADLHQDAPFSSYPGVSRWFLPIGNGRLTLVFKVGGVEHPVVLHGASDAHFFSGNDELTMLLHDGPMKALNVMTTGRVPDVVMRRMHCLTSGVTFNSNDDDLGRLQLLLIEKGRCRVSTPKESHVLNALDSFTFGANEQVAIEPDDEIHCEVISVMLKYSI